jgi:hypothetical protein
VEQLDIGYATPVVKSPVEILAAKVGQNWSHLAAAQERAIKERQRLRSALEDLDGADSSIESPILLTSTRHSRLDDDSRIWDTRHRDGRAYLATLLSATT